MYEFICNAVCDLKVTTKRVFFITVVALNEHVIGYVNGVYLHMENMFLLLLASSGLVVVVSIGCIVLHAVKRQVTCSFYL